MTLRKLKTEFREGRLPKPEYIDRMHGLHGRLFEYADFIRETDIRLIEISDDKIVMTSRERGIRLLCDKDDKRIIPIEILNFDQYEKEYLALILRLIDDGETVLDIGANVGWFAINVGMSREHSPIHCFEPIPKTYDYLMKNLEMNRVPNVRPHNFGFSDREGNFEFYYYPEGSVNASLANVSGTGTVETIACRVRKLDDFVTECGTSIDFIKCDVEGAELFVFKGGMKSIAAHRPVIFAELLRKWAGKFDYHPNEVIRLLSAAGYRCFIMTAGALKEFFMMDDSTVETNFIFLHADKHATRIKSFI